ncbi:hypothetical protein [Terribacillus sp. JSM ZJ617]|uniref:hypothetical protein n=1 Tax=Terribacillus sp. JSM ZJ617 TaxID=3342119 RepID=UPI0035A8274E
MKKMTAADMMQELVESGMYIQLKTKKRHLEQIKNVVKEELINSEVKRHEFIKQGMVAKFVPKQVSKIDTVALNTYLNDLGYLKGVVELDHALLKDNLFMAEQLMDYKVPGDCTVVPYFNKIGKQLLKSPITISQGTIKEHLLSFNMINREYKQLEDKYGSVKQEMQSCSLLREHRKLSYKYGSVIIKDNKPKYENEEIFKDFGPDVLINYGIPKTEKLNDLMLKGSIKKSDLDQFKYVENVRVDFMIMSLEDEEKVRKELASRIS